MYKLLRTLFKGDKTVWGLIIFFFLLSLMLVYSAIGNISANSVKAYELIAKHIVTQTLGIVIIILMVHFIKFKYIRRFSVIFLFIALILLLLTQVVGTSTNSASRWITIPGVGFGFQPSELAKLALIIFTANVLAISQNTKQTRDNAFYLCMTTILIICIIIFLDNISTAALLGTTCFILLWIGNMRLKMLLISMLGILVIITSLYFLSSVVNVGRIGTMVTRIDTFLGIEETIENDILDENYQSTQAKIAIERGGLFGVGPGNSQQRYYLPAAYNDFIFAILIEEYGIFGGVFVLILYGALFFRMGSIANQTKTLEGSLIVIGFSTLFLMQMIINSGVAVGIFPVTGQTLPLVSWGGTSMLFTSVALGIVLIISTEPKSKKRRVSVNGEPRKTQHS